MHEANFDGQKNANVGAQTFTTPTHLSICGAALGDISALSSPFVVGLALADNRISSLPQRLAHNLPGLKSLDLANNRLARLSDLEPLKECKVLTHLTLELNPLAKAKDYREYVFGLVPSLIGLDGLDVDGNEIEEDFGDEDDNDDDDEEEDEYEEEDDEDAGEGEEIEEGEDDDDEDDGENEDDDELQNNKRKRSEDDDDLDGDDEEHAAKK